MPIFKYFQSNSPREVLEKSFNSLVDMKTALSMQQSLILSDIGSSIQQLLAKLDAYDNNCTIRASIDKEIQTIETASRQRNLAINFYSLESHRSSCSSYGQSFLQKHRLLYIRFQKILQARNALQVVASLYLNNPSLLREDPNALSQHFMF